MEPAGRMSTSAESAEPRRARRGRIAPVWFVLRWLLFLLATLWAFWAIYYDGPGQRGSGTLVIAVAWAVVTLTFLFGLRGPFKRGLAWLACFLVVLVPWLALEPSNHRDWKPEWRHTGRAEIQGDLVTFHNFRNFDHALDGSATERWETRTVHFSNLRAVDYFHDAFGGDLLAHPILSFDFGPDGHVALSIETRREIGEDYSKIGGLYKMFELQYLFGDERDLIRVRTNIRREPVHLYRLRADPAKARELFLESIHPLNEMSDHPRWYNVLTANCTTSLRAQTPAGKRRRFDIRILANGKLDELVHERGAIRDDGLSFPELRRAALINPAAMAAHDDPAFPARIRDGRPGF